jgi:ribose 5-phosphate isomerase B
MRKVFIASDHAGYSLKESLVPFLKQLGYETEDCGAYTLEQDDDYPDFITPCALKVIENRDSFGLVLGGSGQGEAMAANRIPGIRAAVYYGEALRPQTDTDGSSLGVIESERAHNDANVLSLGARFLTEEEAKSAVKRFLSTPFLGEERHKRRIGKLG